VRAARQPLSCALSPFVRQFAGAQIAPLLLARCHTAAPTLQRGTWQRSPAALAASTALRGSRPSSLAARPTPKARPPQPSSGPASMPQPPRFRLQASEAAATAWAAAPPEG